MTYLFERMKELIRQSKFSFSALVFVLQDEQKDIATLDCHFSKSQDRPLLVPYYIRYYLSKGTDFKTVSEEEVQDVIEEINNRPRKILAYQTANEVFDQLLAEEQGGVAFNS